MTSLYDTLFDDIPLFVVPGTEDSDVIEFETNMQRNARLVNEDRIRHMMDEIDRLRTQTAHIMPAGLWRQGCLTDGSEHD